MSKRHTYYLILKLFSVPLSRHPPGSGFLCSVSCFSFLPSPVTPPFLLFLLFSSISFHSVTTTLFTHAPSNNDRDQRSITGESVASFSTFLLLFVLTPCLSLSHTCPLCYAVGSICVRRVSARLSASTSPSLARFFPTRTISAFSLRHWFNTRNRYNCEFLSSLLSVSRQGYLAAVQQPSLLSLSLCVQFLFLLDFTRLHRN